MNEHPERAEKVAATEPGRVPRLPFARIGDIQRLPEGERWLIDGFLTGSSITVLASTPKAAGISRPPWPAMSSSWTRNCADSASRQGRISSLQPLAP